MALRRDAPQGPAAGGLRVRADVRVPGTDVERTQRGFFAGCGSSRSGPAAAVLPHERTLSGPKEDRYKLLRATGINTSPVVGLYEDPSGRRRGDALGAAAARAAARRRGRRRRVRHRLWLVTDDGDGPKPPCRRSRRSRERPVHRRRAPPLRDGHPVSRRAADDALVRGGPGVRLPADAVPRRRGAADGAADPSAWCAAWATRARLPAATGSSGCSRSTPVDPRRRSSRAFEAAGRAAGGEGRFGLLTRDGAWRSDGARATRSRPRRRTAATRSARWTSACSPRPWTARSGSTPRRSPAASGSPTRSPRARPPPRSTRRPTARTPRSCSSRRRSPSILAVPRDGDVMPQKSTYFYPRP